jgi:hypothetical protein
MTEDQLSERERRLSAPKVAKRSAKSVQPEREVLKACLQLLSVHQKVAWACRMNTGTMKLDGRFVKFAFKGMSDIIGQLKDGRFMAIEVKREGKYPTAEQNAFLGMVNLNGGYACYVQSVERLEFLLGRI